MKEILKKYLINNLIIKYNKIDVLIYFFTDYIIIK